MDDFGVAPLKWTPPTLRAVPPPSFEALQNEPWYQIVLLAWSLARVAWLAARIQLFAGQFPHVRP